MIIRWILKWNKYLSSALIRFGITVISHQWFITKTFIFNNFLFLKHSKLNYNILLKLQISQFVIFKNNYHGQILFSMEFHRFSHEATVQISQFLNFKIFRHRQLVQVVRQLFGRRCTINLLHGQNCPQKVSNFLRYFRLTESFFRRLDWHWRHTSTKTENLRFELERKKYFVFPQW